MWLCSRVGTTLPPACTPSWPEVHKSKTSSALLHVYCLWFFRILLGCSILIDVTLFERDISFFSPKVLLWVQTPLDQHYSTFYQYTLLPCGKSKQITCADKSIFCGCLCVHVQFWTQSIYNHARVRAFSFCLKMTARLALTAGAMHSLFMVERPVPCTCTRGGWCLLGMLISGWAKCWGWGTGQLWLVKKVTLLFDAILQRWLVQAY